MIPMLMPKRSIAVIVNHTVAISPTLIDAQKVAGSLYTGSPTANVTNGVGPFTYAWSWLAGGTGITIGSATLATCTLSSTGAAAGTTRTGTLRCIVTDTGNGSLAITDSISVTITWA